MSEAAKHTLRTALQTALGLCVLMPAVMDTAGITRTLPWAAGTLAVAAAVTRVMALPGVQALLPSWLRTGIVPANTDADLLSLATERTEPAEPTDRRNA